MSSSNKIITVYLLLAIVMFGALQLEADNIKDPFYNNRVSDIQTTMSEAEISSIAFAYGIDSEQCFSIMTERNLGNNQYLNCKSFVDELNSTIMDDL